MKKLCIISFLILFNIFVYSKNKYASTFKPYKNNYFLLYDSPAKFQFSFMFSFYTVDESETGVYFGYSQKSLWDLWNFDESLPFIENNYSAEIFYLYEYNDKKSSLKQLQFGFEHESNGLGGDEEDKSRSWNKLYVGAKYQFGETFTFAPRIWFPFTRKDNKDIKEFMGFGEIFIEKVFYGNSLDIAFQLNFHKGFSKQLDRLGVEFNTIIGPFKLNNAKTIIPMGIFIQLWHGYGETLLQYNKSVTKLRAGFSYIFR